MRPYVVQKMQRLCTCADQYARAVMQSHVAQVTLPNRPHPSIVCEIFGISLQVIRGCLGFNLVLARGDFSVSRDPEAVQD